MIPVSQLGGKVKLLGLALVALTILAGCGGGEDALKQSSSGDLRKAALSASSEELPQALSVVALEKISEVRVGRTTFDYTFRVSIRNDGEARGDVAAQILGAGVGTTILDGQATLSVIEAGETTTAADTIKLRHNRGYPFNPEALQWRITSTRAVVISGFVIDDPVANATVELTSLSSLSVVATATTDQSGQYTTPSLPQSLLVSGYSVVAKGGTINGEPFVGTLRALYGLPSDYQQSHLTFLTTAAAIAAESTGAGPAELAATAEQIGNDAAARGIFPEDWKSLDVATQFSTANSTVVALDGPVKFSDALALLLKGPPPPADGSTSCGLGEIAGELECRARIGPSGGRIYSQSGVGTGDVLAYFPPMTTLALLGHAAVEVVITRSEGGNVLRFSVSTSRELIDKQLTTSLLRSGTLFESSPQYTLPAADFITSLNVEDACGSPDHADMPSSRCLTRVSGIKPGIFVLDGRVYLGKKNYHRVPNSSSYTHATTATDGGIHRRFGATLKASADRSNLRHPVLFVHGYVSRTDEVGTFGGGDGTWGVFPQYVGELVDPNGVLPQLFDRYNFQWRSNASFYTAASDFADAVRYISAQHGGKRVHVIAHSFGGLLVRTALQNLSERDADISGMVQSVTTLGTPHSGIRDPGLFADPTVKDTEIRLPDGWDSAAFESLCGQLSCYEGGLKANIPQWIIDAHGGDDKVVLGGLIAHLRQTQTLSAFRPDQKVLALIGVGFRSLNDVRNYLVDTGDQLITLAGQRLLPDAAECSDETPFLFSARLGGAIATERVLGLIPRKCVRAKGPLDPDALTPYSVANGLRGDNDAYYGYAHTAFMGAVGTPSVSEANEAEIPLKCGGSIACMHDSWVSTKALLLSFHGGPPSPDFAAPMSVRSASCKAPVVGTAMICTITGSGLPESTSFRATNCTPSPMTAVSGGSESERTFSCTPLSEGVLVAVSYEVPGFIGPLQPIPTLPAGSDPSAGWIFTDHFDGAELNPAVWTPNFGTGGVTVGGGLVTFGARAGANTQGKRSFDGSRLVVEFRMAGQESRRDTTVSLIDVRGGHQIQVGDTNYRGWGFYAIGYGDFQGMTSAHMVPHGSGFVSALGGSTSAFLEYRITVENDVLTVERGPSLAQITQTMTIDLNATITGRRFHLAIGTADENYSPGTFDWIRVQASSIGATLNDTGVTANQCYATGSSALVSCSSAGALALNSKQDGMIGLDVTDAAAIDGRLGFSYEKLDSDGAALDPTASTWSCLRDKVTGLMWEIKTADSGLRDRLKVYTNFGDRRPGDASAYVEAVNATSLCGHSDWRLPDILELHGIVDYGTIGTVIDTAWFINMPTQRFTWTATPSLVDTNAAWRVRFDIGDMGPSPRNLLMAVRLVRGTTRISNFSVSSDGTEVTDSSTGLVWRRCPEGITLVESTCAGTFQHYSHEAGLAHARDVATATGKPWRLPNIKELATIFDFTRISPFADPAAFPNAPGNWFLSSTPYAASGNTYFGMAFNDLGGAGFNSRNNSPFALRLVRDQ